jgi:hypothetical protein
MRKTLIPALLALLCLATADVNAQKTSFSAGPEINGFGIGASGSAFIGEYVSVSGEFGFMPLGIPDLEIEGIEYSIDTDVLGLMLAANVHPFRNSFSVGVGLLFGKYLGKVETVDLMDAIEVGDDEFDPNEVGSLVGEVENSGTWPAVMIGFRGRGMNFGLGLAFIKDTEVDIYATGPINSDSYFQSQLRREIKDIRNELLYYAVPIFRLGYQFGIGPQ